MNGDDRQQRLDDLDQEVTGDQGDTPPIPPDPPDPDPGTEYDEFMDGLSWKEAVNAGMDFTDTMLDRHGLTLMNPMQRTLIRVGISGVAKKYNLDLDLSDYPELVLAAGVLWVVWEKKMEMAALVVDESAASG